MPIPESENSFPAFSQPGTRARRSGSAALALALTLCCGYAQAGPAEDYDAGVAAYRIGDMLTAMTPLKRAADEGHPAAQALYGDILDKAEMNEEAVEYLRKAAEQGNADGQYGLGVMYLGGEGVERSPAEAERLLRAAAGQNHVLAINALATAYIKGDANLGAGDRNGADARAFVLKAAEAGYLPAMDALAAAYRSGDFGLAADAAQADGWAAKAAEVRKQLAPKSAKK